MRRVTKIGPPEGSISKTEDALTWEDLARDLAKNARKLSPEDVRKKYFGKVDKRSVRARLLEEQGGLCVFCEGYLPADTNDKSSSVRIAHWMPIVHDRTLALEWSNLYASCDRKCSCDCSQTDFPHHP